MTPLWQTVGQLFQDLGVLLAALLAFLLHGSLIIVWLAWCLWAVNWTKTWAVLARGAWLPVVLIMVLAALVWSRMAPGDCNCLGFVTVPNFWWQLGAVSLLAALTLFCGWLQGVFGWAPAELELEPALAAGGHGHGHEHS